MSFEDDRTRQVRIGQAMNLAVTLAVNEHMGEDADMVLATANNLVKRTYEFIVAHQTAAEFQGATVEANPQAEPPAGQVIEPTPQQAPQWQPQQQAPQPAPVPGVQDGDPATAALWEEFFSDPTAWWDNRNSKTKPTQPDFKNKDNRDKALWIVGKKNPSWLYQRLAQAGLG